MPKRAVKLNTPPAELADRSEGWGVAGHIEGVAGSGDNGVWPRELPPLYPSKTMYNRFHPLEHPETSDVRLLVDSGNVKVFETTWVRVKRDIDNEEIHGYDSEGNPIQYVHYDRVSLGLGTEINFETDYELHQMNTAITYSDYPPD